MIHSLPPASKVSRAFREANPHLYAAAPSDRREIPHPEPREFPSALETDDAGEARGTGRPFVCFTLRRVQLLDVDAKYASLKHLLDGCVTAGLLPGDREGEITLGCQQEKVGSYAEEETVIDIVYPSAQLAPERREG
jgi:hypothetical protein